LTIPIDKTQYLVYIPYHAEEEEIVRESDFGAMIIARVFHQLNYIEEVFMGETSVHVNVR